MDSKKNISSAVIETIKSSEFGSLAAEYAEIGIDSVLTDAVLQDIPVVRTLLAIGRLGASINDRVFAKKLIRFLTKLSEIDAEDRAAMVDRLDNEDGFRRKVGDRLIELLDRIDSQLKPEMLATAFRAYAEGRIDGTMLNRLNGAIERLPFYEITAVRNFHDATDEERRKISETTLAALTMAGLAIPISAWGGMVYKPNEVCDEFVEIALDRCT